MAIESGDRLTRKNKPMSTYRQKANQAKAAESKRQKVLKAVAYDLRRAMLNFLVEVDNELCVYEIAEQFDISAGSASRHLQILRAAQLVVRNPEGGAVYYRVNPPMYLEYQQEIALMFKKLSHDLDH